MPCWPGSSASRRSIVRAPIPRLLLAELRELVREAETWARRERDPGADAAAKRLAERAIDRAEPNDAFATRRPTGEPA